MGMPIVPERRWARYLLLVISAIGLGISAYLTYAHYHEHIQVACPTNAVINCADVLGSPYAVVFGLPISAHGLIWFLGLAALQALQLFVRPRPTWLSALQLLWLVGGVASVFYLVYVELFLVNAICLWCTSVHLLVLITLVIILMDTFTPAPEWTED